MNDKKKETLRGRLVAFVQQYRRKAYRRTHDPNDRQYSRKMEKRVQRMKPEDLDDLIND